MSQELTPTKGAQVPALAQDRFERAALQAWHEQVDTDPTPILKRAMWVLIIVFGFGGLWSVSVDIGGAVIASGRVIAKDRNRVVQHLEGGILDELMVREGDRVQAGDIIARLDDTQIKAQLNAAELQRAVFDAQLARRRAETQFAETIAFPPDVPEHIRNTERYQETVESERQEFDAQRRFYLAKMDILETKIAGQNVNIQGTQAILEAYERQLVSYRLELKDFRELLTQGLIKRTQVFATERKVAEVEAQLANAKLEIENARNNIDNLTREKRQTRLSYLKEANSILVQIQQRINQTEAQITRLRDMAARSDIKSPVDGTIFRIATRTLGAVVRPGETMLEIFPHNDALTIEASVQLKDIEQVQVGQEVQVVFPSDREKSMTPIPGHLVYLSADAVVSEQNPMGSYVAHITINPGEDTTDLLPGNFAEVYIKTEPKTFLEHISRPFTRFTFRMFKG
ncbi:HlyD family type I secretion periplasmic adaptor subunit [Kordiimonas lipolytica]|uniref:Membrane fusion protein (MFP) family protein n=1 Tax=Kordiimonas lipolytica TaxID=1662421 RepID=A0ABV8U8V7_9PROT|nr:HlyD family type I secretion periplasmic adaptor subunit [Kordiimonas lipolytica]